MAEQIRNITVVVEVDTNKRTVKKTRTGVGSLDEVADIAREMAEEMSL